MATDKDDRSKTRKFIELYGPPLIFGLFVAAGCFYIIAAKHFAVRQVYVTLVPVLFMVAYGLIMGLYRLLRVRDDQAGDNIYYMGFLYTLTSLAAALYQFNASGDSEYIVQNFGVAIASTIAGILFRVMWNQMRRDPAEVERHARVELAEAAYKVRVELDQTVLEFNGFRRGLQQSLKEGFDEIGRQVETVGKTLLKGLEEVTEKSAAPLEAASKSSGATIDEMTKQVVAALEASARKLSEENEKLSVSAKAIAGSLDGVKERLTAMQAPDEVIKIKLDPTIQGLASAVDRFTARIDQHEKVFGAALESARLSSEATREAVDRIRITTTDSEAGIRETIGSLKDILKSQGNQFEGVLKRTDETLAALKEIGTAASERDAKHMETLSKLLPEVEKAENVIEISRTKEATPTPEPEAKRGGFFRAFGGNS
jgi:hypothetical protein